MNFSEERMSSSAAMEHWRRSSETATRYSKAIVTRISSSVTWTPFPRNLLKEYSSISVREEEQETNDQTKAFHYLLKHWPEVKTVHVLGATGKREAHTIGNLGQIMEYARLYAASGNPAEDEVYVDVVSDYSTAFALTDSCELFVGEGRAVSIFSPDNSLNIKSEGLVWQTSRVVFDNWWQATLNRASSDVVKLTFSHKSIALVILD